MASNDSQIVESAGRKEKLFSSLFAAAAAAVGVAAMLGFMNRENNFVYIGSMLQSLFGYCFRSLISIRLCVSPSDRIMR